MRIAFLYLPGRLARLPELGRREVPTEFFYGATELVERGHTIEHFEFGRDCSSRVGAAMLDVVHRAGFMPPKVTGSTLVNAWQLAPELERFDCVVATVAHHGFALGCCRLAGRFHRPLVTIQCGLLHRTLAPARRALTRALLGRMESVFFGEAEVAPTQAAFALSAGRLHGGQFGVDTRFWTPPGGAREGYVLAIGNDPRRDYQTLLAAAPRIDRPIRLVTRLPLPEPVPPNLTVMKGSWHDRALSDGEIRDLYRHAACVVTPLHDSWQPSGQSVTLQAMACGAPVVLTETRGLWNRARLRDGENLRLIPPADPAALAGVVNELLSTENTALVRAARDYVEQHASISGFARDIEAACERAVARA